MSRLGRVDDALEFLGALRPREGGAGLVVRLEVLQQKAPERVFRAIDALREPLLAQDAEEDLDEIDPGRMRRRVMKMDPGMALKPPAGRGVLVNVQVVEHHM